MPRSRKASNEREFVMAKKRTKRALTPQEKEQRLLRKNILTIFLNCGFNHYNTNNIEFKIGSRERNEIDFLFVRDNIIIIAEDTIATSTAHIRTKKETAEQIFSNKKEFLNVCNDSFAFDTSAYSTNRWKIFYLYFCGRKLDLSSDDLELYKPLKFVSPSTLSYFLSTSSVVKKSFVYELYRFLNLKNEDIGNYEQPSTESPLIPIVYPNDVSGLNNGATIVSFMLSAEKLIKNGYVLRKDNWETSIGLYQRLVSKNKIKSIRQYVSVTKRTFFNNIIVSLPKSTLIMDQNGNKIDCSSLDRFQNCSIQLPDEFNSIGIIDGQHRIYSYYENNTLDEQERLIENLRKRIYLLVTGIIFPDDWKEEQRIEFESSIFLDINNNAKKVGKDIILSVEAAKHPFERNSIARKVIEKMNDKGPFYDRFQLNSIDDKKIKIASIIQFALSKLVEPNETANGLYKYWKKDNPSKNIPETLTQDSLNSYDLLKEYIDHCVTCLNIYFNAIKNVYSDQWNEKDAKVCKIFAINSFIIALHHSLEKTDGVKDFEFYKNIYNAGGRVDLDKIMYAGSQYNMFATNVLLKLFDKK